ncbi:hypothetical protein G6F37_000618 [Rhizopus arrhizus]|nr:hypothetical protein G6F38_008087 [Rhizopus arrhizus]KAG1164091.1 hypothetical protein G6F37_000618 [Rhizopus arrhizus]
MDDCSNNYGIEQQQPLPYVHPLQILSPSVHDTFLASFRLEENLNITQNEFSLDESRLYSSKEDETKSLLYSVGDDIFSEDEENKEMTRDEEDIIYKSEDSIDDDDDSDWEKPRKMNNKKRQSFPSFTNNKTKSRKSSFLSQKDDIKCYHCQTTNTPLWRRSPEGAVLCNACGLFLKLHGVVRPLSLKSDVIKKRNRSGKRQKTRRQKKQRI